MLLDPHKISKFLLNYTLCIIIRNFRIRKIEEILHLDAMKYVRLVNMFRALMIAPNFKIMYETVQIKNGSKNDTKCSLFR